MEIWLSVSVSVSDILCEMLWQSDKAKTIKSQDELGILQIL